jgi:DNA processing protein
MSKAHWLALAALPGLGGVTLRKLLEEFGDAESIWQASPEELAGVPRVTPAMAEQILHAPIEEFEKQLHSLEDEEIDLLTWDDRRFPPPLLALRDAPIVLFVRGAVKREDRNAVAIVGTRAPGAEGVETATNLARELATRGLTVVSGLALGIDTAAHVGALAAEEGRTIAVLGSGIRNVHPRENAELAARIVQHGAVLSELLPNTAPRGPQLMARDRLISGLSQAVIVIEAGTQSGSLDTAHRAEKQGRLVYAVPGSPGTDGLLRLGAKQLDAGTSLDAVAEEISSHPIPPPVTATHDNQQRLL